VTDRGCACRAAADPTGHDATLAFTGLLAMTAGLAFRRRRMMTSRRRSHAEPGLFFGFGARRRRIS
jgi:MYXO-CTERM domain-containing protein